MTSIMYNEHDHDASEAYRLLNLHFRDATGRELATLTRAIIEKSSHLSLPIILLNCEIGKDELEELYSLINEAAPKDFDGQPIIFLSNDLDAYVRHSDLLESDPNGYWIRCNPNVSIETMAYEYLCDIGAPVRRVKSL